MDINCLSVLPSNQLIELPVLNKLLNNALHSLPQAPLKNTAIIYIHHPLQTSVNVLQALIDLGAAAEQIFVLGKHYSECPKVVNQIINMGIHYQRSSIQKTHGSYAQNFIRDINWLWLKVKEHLNDTIDKILILDHGGHAMKYTPPELIDNYKIIGIEKTTAGLINLNNTGYPSFPLINAAGSAAKRFLESPLIAEAVVSKLMTLIPDIPTHNICGIAGFGAIGKAITEKLIQMGHKVIVYDKQNITVNKDNEHNFLITDNLEGMIANSDYIFGCSGQDITESICELFRLSSNNKTLISCSSEDKEFLSLIQFITRNNTINSSSPLDNLVFDTPFGAKISILRGGFPVNFDNSGESVPAQDIQLTRSLVLAAVIQAIDFFNNPEIVNNHGLYALDPFAQQFIVHEWLKTQSKTQDYETFGNYFTNIDWILTHSNGAFEKSFALTEFNTI